MKLFELDSNNPIDRELAKTSNDVANDGSLDQGDIDAQADPDMDAGEEETVDKDPVDATLMGVVQGHDYMQRYDHTDSNAASHPAAIMNLEMADLSQLRNRLRGFLDRTGIADRIGMYDDPRINAARDQLSFVDKVMAFKKTQAKDDKTASGKRPKVRTQEGSKVRAGQKIKAKKF